MVEPVARIGHRAGELRHPLRQLRRARRIVVQAVEIVGEAVEIVDGLRPFGRSIPPAARCSNAPRPRRSPWAAATAGRAIARKVPRRQILQDQRRRAVRNERPSASTLLYSSTATWQPVCNGLSQEEGRYDAWFAEDAVALAVALLWALLAAPARPRRPQRMVAMPTSRSSIRSGPRRYITRNHGYMIYDVLFATDADFKVQPQMAEKYEVSRRQAHLDHSPCATGWNGSDGTAGHRRGLHRLDQALGRARRARPAAAEVDRRAEGDRRQDLRHRAQGAVRPGARGAGQGLAPTCPS